MRADFADEFRCLPPTRQWSFAIRSIADAMFVGIQERWIQITKDAIAGFRVAIQAPTSSALALITISLAVFVATVLATLLSAIFLAPLPVSDPSSLVLIWETDPLGKIDRLSFDKADAQRLLQVPDLLRVGWMTPLTGVVSNGRQSAVVRGSAVSEGYLSVYAPRIVYGGDLTAERATKVPIVISSDLWRGSFDADPRLIGKSIILNGVRRTVVGIVAPFNEVNGFQGQLTRSQFWIPIDASLSNDEHRLLAVGRSRYGESTDDLKRAIAAALAKSSRSVTPGATVIPLRSFIVEPLVRDALVGTTAALIVVLLAYVNIAILFSSRVAERARELAIRSMVGATRQRIGAQLFVEAAALLSIGCVFGLACAAAVLSNVDSLGLLPAGIHVGNVPITSSLIALGVTIVGSVVAGLSLRAAAQMRSRLTWSARGRRLRFLRMGFTSAELALAIVVVTFAASLGLRIYCLTHEPLGFEPHDLFLVRFGDVRAGRFADSSTRNSMFAALRDAVHLSPDVVDAEWSSIAPFGNYPDGEATVVYHGITRRLAVKFGAVGPDYFRVLRPSTGTREALEPERGALVVVNEAFIRSLHIHVDPGAARVDLSADTVEHPALRIAAVVPDVRPRYELESPPTMYLPLQDHSLGTEALLVRERAGLDDGGKAIFAAVEKYKGADAAPLVTPFSTLMHLTIQSESSLMATMMLLATIAMGLTASAFYAVLTLEVDERLHEFAVRRAVGASARQVVVLLLARALSPAAVGAAVGLLLATAVSTPWTSIGSVSNGPATLPAIVATALLALALAISISPTLRAVSAHSLRVLRHE